MNLFFFGPKQSPLFGVYHPPARASAQKRGVILCPPIGTELLRSHRALRQLAALFAKSGIHVLRFDYYGTGDSSGDCLQGRVDLWLQDIETAAEELMAMANLDSVSIVGLRMGAVLAAMASPRLKKVDQLVLWDPVYDGRQYLAERIQVNDRYELQTGNIENTAHKIAANDTVGIMGFALSAALRDDLQHITLTSFDDITADNVVLVVSNDDPGYRPLKARLKEKFADQDHAFAFECVPSPGEWGEFDEIGSLLLPHAMIQGIVASMA